MSDSRYVRCPTCGTNYQLLTKAEAEELAYPERFLLAMRQCRMGCGEALNPVASPGERMFARFVIED
jgi:hypothetical protein